MSEQTLIPFPYEEITAVATRDSIRKNNKQGRSTYYAVFKNIKVRPGFNSRIKPADMSEEEWLEELGIEELAQDILYNGLKDPLEGDFAENGETFYITDGHRRSMAIGLLLGRGENYHADGRSMEEVEVIPNPRTFSEKDRILKMLSSNNKVKFKEIEQAFKIKLLIDSCGMKHYEIADKLGKSRQWVDNMIILAQQPQEIVEALLKGQITPTAAVQLARKEKDEDQRVNMVQESIAAGNQIKVKDVKVYEEELKKAEEEEKNGTSDDSDTTIETKTTSKQQKTETREALEAEMIDAKTDPNYKEKKPKGGSKDALGAIDIDTPQREWETLLYRCVSNLDKLTVMVNKLPKDLHQHAGDMHQRLNWISKDIDNAKSMILLEINGTPF